MKRFLVRVCGSSAAPKKQSFDRGGPVWPPRSNVTNDRLRRGSQAALPPQPKTGGSGGQRPPAKNILKKPENECNGAAKIVVVVKPWLARMAAALLLPVLDG